MDPLRNAWRQALWKIKTLLRIKYARWPVLWTEPRLNSIPSDCLRRKLSPDQRAKLQQVIVEVQMLSRCYNYFPETVKDDDWMKLLRCETMKQRLQHLKFCRTKERLKEKDRQKLEKRKEARAAANDTSVPTSSEDRPEMIKMHPAKLARMSDQMESLRYMHALVIDPFPALVVDCQFLGSLSPRGLSQTFLQLKFLISDNRVRQHPWPIYFCNFDFENESVNEERKKHLPPLEPAHGISPEITSLSYVELFPRSTIIYLSPHAEEEIEKIDGSEAFVIGGIVDRVPEKGIHPQASFIAAQRDGVAAKKFPLDRYVKWMSGTKYLTLTAVSNILHDVYESGGDWETTLRRNIPVRNVRAAEEKNKVGKLRTARIADYERRVLAEASARLDTLQSSRS